MRKIILIIVIVVIIIVNTSCSDILIIGKQIYSYKYFFKEEDKIKFAKAIVREDIKKMKYYINKGIDVNFIGAEGITPLYLSVIKKKYKSFVFLLENKADPNYDIKGKYSILEQCLYIKDSRFLIKAIEFGGIINKENSDDISLLERSINKDVPIENFLILLKYGANPNCSIKVGRNPLIDSLFAREYKRTIYLIEYGGEISITKEIERYFFRELENSQHFEGTRQLKERDELVKYLKEKFNIEVKLKYPNGRKK